MNGGCLIFVNNRTRYKAFVIINMNFSTSFRRVVFSLSHRSMGEDNLCYRSEFVFGYNNNNNNDDNSLTVKTVIKIFLLMNVNKHFLNPIAG